MQGSAHRSAAHSRVSRSLRSCVPRSRSCSSPTSPARAARATSWSPVSARCAAKSASSRVRVETISSTAARGRCNWRPSSARITAAAAVAVASASLPPPGRLAGSAGTDPASAALMTPQWRVPRHVFMPPASPRRARSSACARAHAHGGCCRLPLAVLVAGKAWSGQGGEGKGQIRPRMRRGACVRFLTCTPSRASARPRAARSPTAQRQARSSAAPSGGACTQSGPARRGTRGCMS